MQRRISPKLRILLSVPAVVALLGCLEDGARMSAQASNTSNPPALLEAAGAAAPTNEPAVVAAVAVPPETVEQAPAADIAASVATPARLSPGVAELAKLAQGSVGDEVLLTFVQNYSAGFSPSVDEILYLSDLGVSDSVITALMKKQPTAALAATPAPEVQPGQIVTSNVIPSAPQSAQAAPQEQTAPPPTEVTVNQFYSALSPYGTWVDVDNYGRVWQPTVVVANPRWRPYSDRGRWLNTDAGWYWSSDYSWGWAPFHYGRWHCHPRYSWVWVPDTHWGPSWVSWRHHSDYSGWAPLPPYAHYDSAVGFSYHGSRVGISFEFGLSHHHYTFIPTARFCDPRPYHHYVPHHRSVNIYNNTVVNNYYVQNNNTVVNRGIDPNRVAAARGSKVQKVALRDMPAQTAANAPKKEVLDRDGNTLTVFRPRSAAAANGRTPAQGFAGKPEPTSAKPSGQIASGLAQSPDAGATTPGRINSRGRPTSKTAPQPAVAGNTPAPASDGTSVSARPQAAVAGSIQPNAAPVAGSRDPSVRRPMRNDASKPAGGAPSAKPQTPIVADGGNAVRPTPQQQVVTPGAIGVRPQIGSGEQPSRPVVQQQAKVEPRTLPVVTPNIPSPAQSRPTIQPNQAAPQTQVRPQAQAPTVRQEFPGQNVGRPQMPVIGAQVPANRPETGARPSMQAAPQRAPIYSPQPQSTPSQAPVYSQPRMNPTYTPPTPRMQQQPQSAPPSMRQAPSQSVMPRQAPQSHQSSVRPQLSAPAQNRGGRNEKGY